MRSWTAIILILHDMGNVAEMADRVIVMQNGQMVEEAATQDLFARPAQCHTQELLAIALRLGQGTSRPVNWPDLNSSRFHAAQSACLRHFAAVLSQDLLVMR